jgi:hypothetical protein
MTRSRARDRHRRGVRDGRRDRGHPDDVPARLLRLLRRRRPCPRRGHRPGARRCRPLDEPRCPLRQVLRRVQQRMARSRRAPHPPPASGRSQGRRAVRSDLVERGHRHDRRPVPGDRRRQRGADHHQRPLQRHDLAARLLLPDALLPPPRGHRGGPRQHLQPGRPRRPRLRLRHLVRGVRPAHGPRRRLHRSLGHQPRGLGSARLRALVPPGDRRQDRRRSDPHRDGEGGRPAPAAVPGQRRGAGVRAAARATARRPARPRISGSPYRRLGGIGAAAGRLHLGLGRGDDRRPRQADRAGRAPARSCRR